jgi:hypothetical protein
LGAVRKILLMAIPPHEASPLAEAARAAAERDAGVRRVRRATRWLAAGAVGLTGALAGVVAQQTLPASASSTRAAAATAQGSASSEASGGYATEDGSAYGSDDGSYANGYEDDGGTYSSAPQAPAQAPQPAPQTVAPSASSGAS